MSKKAHHSNNHRSHGVVAGAVSALSLLAVSTQAVNAEQLTVKAGDTIWGLAKQHGLSVSALEQANPSVKKLSDSVDLITVGQQLTLPTAHQDTSAELNADGSYTVKPGDTLGLIAARYNVSVDQLIAWNGLGANDSLYIGQQLSVTGPTAVVSQQSVAAPVQQSTVSSAVAVSAAPQQQSAVASQQAVSAVAQVSAGVTSQQVGSDSSAVASESVSPATQESTVASTATSTTSAGAVVAATSTTPLQAPVSTISYQATNSATSSVETQQLATSQAATTSYNAAAVYQQSFVQTATPAASQAAQLQQSATPQSNVASQAPAVTQQQTSTSQPVASAAQSTQQQANAGSQDLQHGSVVSLATKIANTNSVPYEWGGSDLNGMDCSGLVKYVYANAENKQLPHNTVALESCVDQHSVSEAKAGDLLFWGNHGSTYHTAIYTGNNQFVAAAKPGTNVATYTISPYFQPSFAGTVK